MKYFQALASELQLNKQFFTHYYNIPIQKQRQSSVAIIFKLTKPTACAEDIRKQIEQLYQNEHPQQSVCSQQLITKLLENVSDNDVEMLFAQRATNEADFNSGNVCFPGGKADGDESDLKACIRQVRQEVGINLLSKQSPYLNVYMGKFKHNFFFRKTRTEKVFISCHLFLILNPNVTMILNSSQIYDSKWINFNRLISQTPFICRSKQNTTGLSSFPLPFKYLQNSIKNNLNCIKYSAIEVELGSPLWGLSLHLYLHMLRVLSNKLPKQQTKQLYQRIKMGETFEAEFNKFYPLAYPCEWFIKSWNKKHRINAFKSPPVQQSRFKTIAYILLLVVAVYLLNLYFNN